MKNLRKNNKGFSLVELIIVISIIAILAVVLAPQYLKYVEKSRVSVDKDTAAAIEQAVNVLCADGTLDGGEVFTWYTVAAEGHEAGSIDGNDSVEKTDDDNELKALTDLLGKTSIAAQSTVAKTASAVTFTVNIDSGILSVVVDVTGEDAAKPSEW